MSQPRPHSEQITAALGTADAAMAAARKTRARYRGRKTPGRVDALCDARARCEAAAEPMRSWLGMVAWGGIALEDELAMKKAMADLRYERRQIAKML
jgi:hypothetical protein